MLIVCTIHVVTKRPGITSNNTINCLTIRSNCLQAQITSKDKKKLFNVLVYRRHAFINLDYPRRK